MLIKRMRHPWQHETYPTVATEFPELSGKTVSGSSDSSLRTLRTAFFQSLPRTSFKANPLPSALLLALIVGNIMPGRDPELMHNRIPNDRAKLISGQRPPAVFVAKLDICSVTVSNG